MAEGFISLYRALAHHTLWLEEKFTRGQAWVDLLMLANHKPGAIRVRGIRIEILRGQVGHSEVTLAVRWRWSRDKVRRFMHELELEKMVIVKRDNKISIITIVNYDKYQIPATANDTADKTANKTAEKQQTDTNNNGKNENNKKESSKTQILFVEGAMPLRLATYLFNCIRLNRPEFKQPDLQAWARQVDLMIRIDKRDPDQIREVIKWAQADNTPQEHTGFCWAANILSTAKLRKQFDQLAIKMAAAKKADSGSSLGIEELLRRKAQEVQQ